jgi:hypothetical protein
VFADSGIKVDDGRSLHVDQGSRPPTLTIVSAGSTKSFGGAALGVYAIRCRGKWQLDLRDAELQRRRNIGVGDLT